MCVMKIEDKTKVCVKFQVKETHELVLIKL